jgi:hypothetical protein
MGQACILWSTFQNTRFNDVSGNAAASRYRVLKYLMESARNLHEEGRFYALEQRSIRHDPNTAWSVKLFSLLYDLASVYGQSFVRPLGILLLLIVGWTMLFVLLSAPSSIGAEAFSSHVADRWAEALELSIYQLTRPFHIWSWEAWIHNELAIALSGTKLIAKVLGAVESLIGFGLIALSLLALRRRFKMS